MNKILAGIVFCFLFAQTPFAIAKEASLDTVDVYIVPLDDFPEAAAAVVAKSLSSDLKLWVKGTLRLGALDVPNLPGTNQLVSEDIIEKSQSVLRRLPERSDKTYFLLLTTKDINSRAGGTRFQFSTHNKALNTSVISMARMMDYVNGQPVLDEMVSVRLFKMVKRAIGEMRLGWKRSTNIEDIMYSPIMGVQDLDQIGIGHIETPPQGEKLETQPHRLNNAI
jgi:predicted Zn-dependent protease